NPRDVLGSFARGEEGGQSLYERGLMTSIAYSFFRTTVGFLIAAAVAVPLGIFMGSFTPVREFFSPLTTIGGYIPIAVLVPLTLSWFGLGEKQKFLFLALATFVLLLPLVVDAVDKIDDAFLQTAYTLGATRLQTILHVIVPVSLGGVVPSVSGTVSLSPPHAVSASSIESERMAGLQSAEDTPPGA
ncbi:MAG: ABC transporter permease subunit, partial [Elusimicrobiota bacterium]